MTGLDVQGPKDPTLYKPLERNERAPGDTDVGPAGEGNLGGGEQYYQDIQNLEMQGPPAPPLVDVSSPSDLWDAKSSKELYELTLEAFAAGDKELADQYTQLQREQALISEARVTALGGDPTKQVTSNASWTGMDVEAERQAVHMQVKNSRQQRVFQDHGFAEFKSYFFDSVIPRYKEKNEAILIQKSTGMSEQQLMEYHQQLEPVIEDYAVLEEWQQRLNKMNAALKATDPSDPSLSVYTHPVTKQIAGWIGREVNAGQMGFMVSDKRQDPDYTMMQKGSEYAFSAAKPVIDFAGMLAFGVGPMLSYLTNDTVGWNAPTNYIETPDGKIVTNAGKVPGGVELGATAWALVTGENVKDMIARANAATQWEEQNDHGFDSVVKGIGYSMGVVAGGGGILGGAMKAGFKAGAKLGTAAIVTKGLAKLGMSNTPRALKLTELISGTAGAVSANALAEGIMFGKPESYGRAIIHGALMAPVMVGVAKAGSALQGALGARTPRMPSYFHRGVSGAAEGGIFTTIEMAQSESIWGLIHDPNKSTLETYFESMVGFGLFKAAFGRGMLKYPEAESSRRQGRRDMDDRMLGEEIYEAEQARGRGKAKGKPIEVSEEEVRAQAKRDQKTDKRGLSEETLQDIGRAEKARKTARTPKEESEAQKLIEDSKGRKAREDQGAGKQGRISETKMDAEITGDELKSEISRLHDEGPTPENRKRLIELLDQQRGKLTGGAADMLRDLGKQLYGGETKAPVTQGRRVQVEGQEPTVPAGERGKEQIKGKLPNAEESIQQAQRGELDEGEVVDTADVLAKRNKKEETQGNDPLEDPNFMERPENDRRKIMQAGGARERRLVAEEFDGKERRRDEAFESEMKRELDMLQKQGEEQLDLRKEAEMGGEEAMRTEEGHPTVLGMREDGGKKKKKKSSKKKPDPEIQRMEEELRRQLDAGEGTGMLKPGEKPLTFEGMEKAEFNIPNVDESARQMFHWVKDINEAGGPTVKGVSDINRIPELELPGFVARVREWLADFKDQGYVPYEPGKSTKLLQVAFAYAKEGKYPPTPQERQKASAEKAYQSQKAAAEKEQFERSQDPEGWRKKDIERAKQRIVNAKDQLSYMEGLKKQKGENEYYEENGGDEQVQEIRFELDEAESDLDYFEGGGEDLTLGMASGGGGGRGGGGAPPPAGASGGVPRPRRPIRGTGSMQEAASPYRNKEGKIGAVPIRMSDIINVASGRYGSQGVRIPFMAKRVGATKGTAVVVPIRGGHLKARHVGGVYDIFSDITRTKEGLNVVVTAHEWGHAAQVQMMFKGIRPEDVMQAAEIWTQRILPPRAQMEIPALLEGYGGWEGLPLGVQGMEGWAEWMARELLGDETLDTEAPNFSAYMRKWIAHPSQSFFRETSFNPLKAVIQAYMDQGFESQADESFLMKGEGQRVDFRSPLEAISDVTLKVVDKMTNAWFDDLAHLKAAERRSMRHAGIEPSSLSIFEHPSRVLDITRNLGFKQTENFFLEGAFDLSLRPKPGTKGLLNITRMARPNVKQWGLYVAHVRAWQLAHKGKKMTLPAKVYAASVLAKSRRHPEFKKAARELKKLTDAVLDVGVEAGLFSIMDAERMKDAQVLYIPLAVAMEGPPKHAAGRGVAEKGKGTKRLRGHTMENMDPLEALQHSIQEVLVKSYQNVAMKALWKLSLKPGMGSLVTIVDRSMVPEDYRIDDAFRTIRRQVRKEMRDKGLSQGLSQALEAQFGFLGWLMDQAGVSDSLITMFTEKVMPIGETGYLIAFTPNLTVGEISGLSGEGKRRAIKQNGKMQWMEVNPEVYKTLMGVNQESGLYALPWPVLREILMTPKKLVQFSAVRGNAFFAVDNLLRDIPSHLVYTAPGVSSLKDALMSPIEIGKQLPQYASAIAAVMLNNKNDEIFDLFEHAGVGMSSFFSEGTRAELRGDPETVTQKINEARKKITQKWINAVAKGEESIRYLSMDKAYKAAKAAGESDMEARFIAIEAGQEEIINFARGGVWAKIINQMAPFVTASFNGVRKTLRSLAGVEGKTDQERAARQRGVFIKGFTLFTIPQIISWLMNSDEDWYEDLSEAEKLKYIYFSRDIRVPVPYELGVAFNGLPQAIMDKADDRNPVGLWPLVREALLPYMQGLMGFFPTAAKGLFEVRTDYNLFFGDKISGRRKTESAEWVFNNFKPMAKAFGADTAKQLEHLLDSYTAGKATYSLQLIETAFGVSHPLFDPLSRFHTKPHGRSRFVNDVYKSQSRLQDINPEDRTPEEHRELAKVTSATKTFANLRRLVRMGKMEKEEADRRSYEIAKRITK